MAGDGNSPYPSPGAANTIHDRPALTLPVVQSGQVGTPRGNYKSGSATHNKDWQENWQEDRHEEKDVIFHGNLFQHWWGCTQTEIHDILTILENLDFKQVRESGFQSTHVCKACEGIMSWDAQYRKSHSDRHHFLSQAKDE